MKYVIQVTAQGSHTPSVMYPELIKNSADVPTELNKLTSLGVRQ